ncbi:MAG TPA: betaine/proline/choline family ABC transporter ATP-binding protein [Angustibacter sp.]|nr:betaine/proline/choline family ABC transporter ATP-binding protein [Angustibacter sp.]
MSDLSTTTRPQDGASDDGQAAVSGARIQLVDVTKRYPGQKAAAVDGISLDIPAGEVVMLVGPSGCGKTTTLKMINRLIEPTSGQILIDGADARRQDADTLRRKIGYVIQGGSLFPHLTVAANIALVPGLLKWDKRRIAERVDELLELVGLDPVRYRDRYPRELSGGQQQRVGVARGLAADPPVILMDEPFGAVDPITRQRLQDELLSIQDELHKTIVCVTHDFDEAVKLGDRIVILREGATIAQYDTPDAILAAPADRFVEDFVGAGAALKQLTLTRVSDVDLDQPPTAAAGEDVAEVRERMRAAGHRSVIVLDERRRPLRWDWDRDLDGATTVAQGSTDLITVDRRATLNDALDSMLTSGHGGAIVTGRRDEYVGVVTVQTVMDRIQQVREEAAEVSG